jgi:hypothetical protein
MREKGEDIGGEYPVGASTSQILYNLIISTNFRNFHFHFTEEETGVQRSKVMMHPGLKVGPCQLQRLHTWK